MQSPLGLGPVQASSESAATRALPQSMVKVGALLGRIGSPRRLQSATRNSASERVNSWAVRIALGRCTSAEAQPPSTLRSHACAICPSAVLRRHAVQTLERVVVGYLGVVGSKVAVGGRRYIVVQGGPQIHCLIWPQSVGCQPSLLPDSHKRDTVLCTLPASQGSMWHEHHVSLLEHACNIYALGQDCCNVLP
jgi:hypothetical protein